MDKAVWYDTNEEALAAFKRHQEQTCNTFVVYTTQKEFKKTARPKVFWDNDKHPFVVKGFKIFICSHGRDKNAKRKKKKSSKKAVENTMKVGCQAKCTIKEILYFPQYVVLADQGRCSRSQVAGNVRTHLQDGQKKFLLLLDDVHINHPVGKILNKTGPDGGDTAETEVNTSTSPVPISESGEQYFFDTKQRMACNLSEPQEDNTPGKYVSCEDRPDLLLDDIDWEFIEQDLRDTRSLGFDIGSEEALEILDVILRLCDDTSGIPLEEDSKHNEPVVNNLVEPDAKASQKERKGTDRDDDTPIDGQLRKDLEVNKEYQKTLGLSHPHQESGPTFMLCPQNQPVIALNKKLTWPSTDFQDINSENLVLHCLPGEQGHKKIEDINQHEVCQESVDYLSPETGELFIENTWQLDVNNITDKTCSNQELQNQLKCPTPVTVTFLPTLNFRHQEITQPLPIIDNGCRGNIPRIVSLLAEKITEPIKSSTKLKLKRKLSKQKVVEEKKRKTDYQDRRSYGRDGGFSHLRLRTEPDPVKDVPVRVQTAGNPTPYKQYLLSDNNPMRFVLRDQTEGDVYWCPGKGSRDVT